MLGIVIGVAAVIVTVAIGVGARTSVQRSINSSGLEPDRRPAGQRHARRRPHRIRRRVDADAGRRPRDRASPRRRRRLADGHDSHAGRRRRKQLADDDRRRRADLHVHSLVAARRRTGSSTRTTWRRRRRSRCSGQTVVGELFPQRRLAARPDRHRQGRSVHGGRHAQRARAERTRSGPGRHRPDSLYLGDGTPDGANDGQRADGLGGERDANRRRAAERHASARTAPPHRTAAGRRLSGAQPASRSRKRHRRPEPSWSCCLRASPPSRSSSAASAS